MVARSRASLAFRLPVDRERRVLRGRATARCVRRQRVRSALPAPPSPPRRSAAPSRRAKFPPATARRPHSRPGVCDGGRIEQAKTLMLAMHVGEQAAASSKRAALTAMSSRKARAAPPHADHATEDKRLGGCARQGESVRDDHYEFELAVTLAASRARTYKASRRLARQARSRRRHQDRLAGLPVSPASVVDPSPTRSSERTSTRVANGQSGQHGADGFTT